MLVRISLLWLDRTRFISLLLKVYWESTWLIVTTACMFDPVIRPSLAPPPQGRNSLMFLCQLCCFGPEMTQIIHAHCPLVGSRHVDPLNNQFCVLLIKGTGKCGRAKGIFDEWYSSNHLWPTRPYLPVSPTIGCSAVILSHHVLATLVFFVFVRHA